LCFEARNYVIVVLDELSLSVAQGIFSGLKSSAKISGILFSLFASFLAGFELFLQIIGAFFGTTQRLWEKG
jgi:uncharacterized YccA/Bax inhibitor family protein